MNHPSNDQWMCYCYDELPKGERAQLAAHLQACAVCAAKVREWEQARRELDTFKISVRRPRASYHLAAPLALKWAAAISVLCLAVALGWLGAAQRASGLKHEAELKTQIRSEFASILQHEGERIQAAATAESQKRAGELIKVFEAEFAAEQKKELRAVYAALDKIDSQRASDFIALKKELGTLAVNADAEFRSTERHLQELATLAQPVALSQ